MELGIKVAIFDWEWGRNSAPKRRAEKALHSSEGLLYQDDNLTEKTEFLRRIQRKKITFIIGNSKQLSHRKQTLTCPQKGLVCSPP